MDESSEGVVENTDADDQMVDLKWCEHCPASASTKEGGLQALREALPQGYQYICCQQERSANVPRVTLRVNIKDEPSVKEWLVKYQDKTLSTWRTARTYPNRGSRTVCRLEKRCQHMTWPRSKSADLRKGSKNTNCPAMLTVIVRRTEFKRHDGRDRSCRSGDHHLPKWPTTVMLKHEHNHPLKAADVLRHRDVSREVRKKLIKLFRSGHTPSSALNVHQYDLQMEHGDDYAFLSEDRHHNPDLNFTWRLYHQIFVKARKKRSKKSKLEISGIEEKLVAESKDKKVFCVSSDLEMVGMLKDKIDKYNAENGNCVRMEVEDDQLVIAIITPLMKRAHDLIKYAGEMVFMDASGSMSRHSSQVFLMMTPSFAGGLPLGAFITTSESKEHMHVKSAFLLGQEILGSTGFYSRGAAGPQVFFTDDLDAETVALTNVYPQSVQILCIYQVLQAFWRHLFKPKFKIERGDASYLFQLMKTLLYAATEAELELAYETIIHDEIVDKYSSVRSMYLRMYERKAEWALCFVKNLPLQGSNTSNFCESAMRILKDKIFHRAKTYNVVQLVDFLLTRMDQYYQKRLLDVGHNRLEKALGSRYISSVTPITCTPKSQIIQESAMEFLVPNEKTTEPNHRVDMSVGLCTCRVGSTGSPCSHQKAVLRGFYIPSWNFIPVNSESMSKLLFQIAGSTEGETLPTRKRALEEDSDELNTENVVDQAVSDSDDAPLQSRFPGAAGNIKLASPQKLGQKQVLKDLDTFVKRIKTGYLNNPCVYKDAMEDFVHQTKKFKTDAELVCALYTFGE